ncbi:hypothetical protein SAMN04489727_0659 [Amycolatopsis tolypomycina]|uniref:Uncharacterized protein n=1 Tax=Amycolatopsis tolypomycina TaxID=208445 RepID=A0A1H4IG58_9PSEU|nr:hypothetical protein [Amycolatopsis tolypomycina]SEB33037.1 hypothetical protein SAMN04489727_0659 [Amycolatopsis tolypomycina]
MASPDTDELATVPLPAGEPEAGARAGREMPGRASGGEVPAVRSERGSAGRGRAAAGPLGGELTVPQERVEPERIEPAEPTTPAATDADTPAEADPPKTRGRWWRGLTGSLAAGLAVLAVGVLGVGVICLFTGAPGPGVASLVGHPVAAGLALGAQRVADRRRGLPAVGAGFAVVLFAVSAATVFWYS